MDRLEIKKFGPIEHADLTFGDLTVFVGPQATGKSIALQTLRLLVDTPYVVQELKRHGLDWSGKGRDFLSAYFGEGMDDLWKGDVSQIEYNAKDFSMDKLATARKKADPVEPRLFYIPAQRVLTLRNGWPRPFTDYSPGDPFAVREYSERLRILMELEFSKAGGEQLFPQTQRITKALKDPLSDAIFHGFKLKIERNYSQKRLVLTAGTTESHSLPFMVWSAGQREFVPLLLGLYWLMPSGAVSRRDEIQWIVIEELEMGLHPRAISSLLLLTLELMRRGYRICLSTHSPHVLEMIWALGRIRECQGGPEKVLELFDQRQKHQALVKIAETAIEKTTSVYYFDREGITHDISRLDPGSDNPIMAEWGGLSEFSSRAADVVADVVAESERRNGR